MFWLCIVILWSVPKIYLSKACVRMLNQKSTSIAFRYRKYCLHKIRTRAHVTRYINPAPEWPSPKDAAPTYLHPKFSTPQGNINRTNTCAQFSPHLHHTCAPKSVRTQPQTRTDWIPIRISNATPVLAGIPVVTLRRPISAQLTCAAR